MKGAPFSVDVLCLGVACYDLIFSVERHVGADEKIRASELTVCGGGLAANASLTVARLGYAAAFAGYLGRDMYGDSHIDELRAAGVNTDLVARGEWSTSLSAILVKPDGARARQLRRKAQQRPHRAAKERQREPGSAGRSGVRPGALSPARRSGGRVSSHGGRTVD